MKKDFSEMIVSDIIDILAFGFVMERKALVDTLHKIGDIQVYADHNPPHFHIETPEYKLSIDMGTCEITKGGDCLSSKQRKNLQNWYFKQSGKMKVISTWNAWNHDNQILEVA